MPAKTSSHLTLEKLGADALEWILLMIHDSSRHSLFSLLVTSKALYEATLPMVYRRCRIDIWDRTTITRIQTLLNGSPASETALRWIRTIILPGHYWYREPGTPAPVDESQSWNPLIQLMSKITNLVEVRFTAGRQIPLVLLNVLHEYHPTTRLHITNWKRDGQGAGPPFADPTEEALARSPCLRSIRLWAYCFEHDGHLKQVAFDHIVNLSPNLEAIYTDSGCSSGGHAARARIRASEAYIHDVNQFAGDEKPRRKPMKKLSLDGVPLDAAALKQLETFVDLRKLVSLQGVSPDPGFLYLAAQEKTFSTGSLKDLGFKLDLWYQTSEELAPALNIFLASCDELELLDLTITSSRNAWSFSAICSNIISRHGHSLRSLVLHHAEPGSHTSAPRSCLSLDEITQIRDNCPNLQRFALDVDRTTSGAHESAVYGLLSTFKMLRQVEIHMDLGLRLQHRIHQLHRETEANQVGERNELKRRMMAYRRIHKFEQSVWGALTKDKAGVRMEELSLFIGDSGRVFIRDEQEQWQRYEIRRSERDDRPDELVVSYAEGDVDE